jgi:beta-glucosidase
MRTATHNILYTTANSWIYDAEHLTGGIEKWKKMAYGTDAVLAVLIVLGLVMAWKKYQKTK